MAEVGIGVLFAIWFIAVYLLVSRLRQRGKRSYGPVSLAPPDTAKLLGASEPKRFLTTAAMSEHHSPKKEYQSPEKNH
ncbi:MAG TPA: hypothetical protein VF708_17715 [Pyrinomonadaceae bacterium]|jgi:hypothetical protein